jgi:phosphohistidine phosphatase
MKRVHLLRHAKSSWKDPSLRDRDRPLAGRGRRAADAIARHLRAEGIGPDLVLCSPALRARETLERIEPGLGRGAVRVEPQLYGTGVDELVELLRRLPDRIESVMLIGHNPTLQELAVALAGPSPELAQIEAKFPTGALVTLAFPESHWHALAPGAGRLESFVRPRDLT